MYHTNLLDTLCNYFIKTQMLQDYKQILCAIINQNIYEDALVINFRLDFFTIYISKKVHLNDLT